MKQTTLRWLYENTGKRKWYIAALLLLQTVLGMSSVYYAVLLRRVIDNATAKNKHAFFCALGLIIGLTAGQILLRAMVRYLEELSRSSLENVLKERLFSTLLQKDFASVSGVHSGEWMNRLTSDTVVTANGLTEILPNMLGMAVKMIGALVMILVLEPKFAFILLPGGALLLLLTYAFRRTLKQLHKRVQETDGKLRVFLQERLGSLLMIRTFAAEPQVTLAAQEKMQAHQTARMRKNRFSNLCNIGFSSAMNGIYLLGVGYCGYGILQATISYGTLMAILQLIGQIQSPFANLTGYLPRFYAMTASAERLQEAEQFADDCPEGAADNETVRAFYQTQFAGFRLEDAAFTYLPPHTDADAAPTKGKVAVQHVCLSIQKGDYVAVTGHSGCGKSTLLKLLMCLYPLDSGARYLQQQDGTEHPLTSRWYRLFGYVPQGNQLMSGSIREVVAFSDPDAQQDTERLQLALRIACADDFVNALPKGIDTVLGERGQGLSDGQMQRIAIARAIFSEHPVLMLDESTSALDERTEQKLLTNLRQMTNKTVLIVTHRTAVLDICSKQITMTEDGMQVKQLRQEV